ncbi:hypothetical protein BO221_15785 [Archangium sp. Cb G35]|uniref:LVIVD repeat-containing protein n=1 Tax=Archangium sp. Cb G35 TaxID=1920190 RepID=UPI0009377ED6|nr:hypothetical protein [Archangium sp. Cb G35]OJT24601.1 hypothetical protein BO221_15785 [Archangium sp. Cb G35]
MKRNCLARAALLGCLLLLTGCPNPGNTGSPDASTPDASTETDASTPDASTGYEWDGGYVPLEEVGNWPGPEPEQYASCRFGPSDAVGCGFNIFDLSACDQDSLDNAGTGGTYMLSARMEDNTGGFLLNYVDVLTLSEDGGTAYLNGLAATESRQGNARLFSTTSKTRDGGTSHYAVVTCAAPQAPEFTGCFAYCMNDSFDYGGTFKSEHVKWRAGESEASGLELVSENPVDLGQPSDVYVTRGHAYVVSSNRRTKTGGLTVFDVSDKTAPVKVKTVEMPSDTNWNGVWAKDNALYVTSTVKGVLVFDISDPANPLLVKSVPSRTTQLNNHTLFVDGNRLYATLNTTVSIFDITSPLEPIELNRYAGYNTVAHDILAVGDRLYVNHGGAGYVVVDVSDTNNLRTLGRYRHYDIFSHANAVGTFAGRTIAFMGGEGPGEHLRVLDVTDPANIVKIGEFKLRQNISIHNMLLVGKKLYLTWYQEGVRVLDVSNPTQPTQVAYFNTWRESDPHEADHLDGAIGIRIPGDGYIYVVDTIRGLLILREK